ncbi:murein DD-endopeptidase MepM/ murein hydrolase activator NlpD [Chryseobacterium sp. 16F]|uniref:Murein DD-endopeptidase MepM/ murein hydrolase activator NlpD n=1 Tax=Frigoriflavimonas asaccharolytica TaxID=2735899 RepID=A0A8J8G6N3_9FLAO|nr:murein DD-endopeptidase MepM/ murein hydrolase activator NlpD [Frigoriflavimonas asaccharolytica]
MKRLKKLKNKKRNSFIILIVLSSIIFAQALIIAKFYKEKQDKKYVVNLVAINKEKDSIDYPQLKNDLENVDRLVNSLNGYLKSKNIGNENVETLAKDSLNNTIYLAQSSNRYSQYLVDLQNKLMGVPIGIPAKGYISSQFGKRKNPIPSKIIAKKTETVPSPIPSVDNETNINTAPQILKIRDSLGNVIDEITIYPKIKASVANAVKTPPQKPAVREENNAPSEADQIQFHKGLDIAVAYGSPVNAAAAGTVIFSGVKGGYGNCVIISHGNGLATLYGHLSELLVKANDQVFSNQLIAKSGNTGRSTGPHLHYEVHKKQCTRKS